MRVSALLKVRLQYGRWVTGGTGRQAAARRGGQTARRAAGAPLSK